MMYPPPYHNPAMRSGEWKLWLESAFNTIRNLDFNPGNDRDNGTASVTTAWSSLFVLSPVGKEVKASLSVAIGGFVPVPGCTYLIWYMDDEDDEMNNTWTLEYGASIVGSKLVCYDMTDRARLTFADGFNLTGATYDADYTIEIEYSAATMNGAWPSNASSTHVIFSSSAYGGTVGLRYSNSGEHAMILYAGSGNADSTVLFPADGTTHHIAYVRKGTTHRLFLDGDKVAEITTSWQYTITAIGIGGTQITGVNWFTDSTFDNLRISTCARYWDDFSPPAAYTVDNASAPMSMRVLVDGVVVETAEYPSPARHFFGMSNLKPEAVIEVQAKYAESTDVDWWYTYEASSEGVESGGRSKYPAPEYLNDDPRWIGRWTDIYKIIRGAGARSPGKEKSVGSDEASNDSYSYTPGTVTINTVTIESAACTARVECYSRSLFTSFELHLDGNKIADLSMFEQRNEPGAMTYSTLCHDIIFANLTEGSHTFVMKGVATTTETGHTESQLHVIYE